MRRVISRLSLLSLFLICSTSFAGGIDTNKPHKSNHSISQPAPDNRMQMPKAFQNSYIELMAGYSNFNFSNSDLVNGFTAKSIQNPGFALRLNIGHFFNRYIAAQLSLMRPVKWIHYIGLAGGNESHSVWISLFGFSLRPTWPISNKFSLYGELGAGLVSRHGFKVNGTPAINNASVGTMITGGGLTYAFNRHWHLDLGLLYTLKNSSEKQPSMFFASAGIYYLMLPSTKPKVYVPEPNYIFPLNFVQVGFFTDDWFHAGVNKYFTPPYIPIFWDGNVKTRNAVYAMYERNFFHTRKNFSLDWGVSVSRYQSQKQGQTFYAFSIFPALRVWIIRSQYVDFYFTYSVAGPTILTKQHLDNINTGSHFTFQDFMGLGFYLGKKKNFNINVKIGHYSNGNLFPTNPGIEVPLTIAVGYTF